MSEAANPAVARKGPLAGLRVLDFSHAAAAPFATMFMGDMGAEVIKIEKPKGGDGARTMGLPMPMLGPKDSEYFVALNRNKQGIVIDLAKPEGAELAKKLAATADIVVENFRPDVMDRLGLGFNDLKQLRPGLIYCSISAFGPSGPWSERPANDIIMQSVSGLMGITGEVGGGPVRIGAPIADFSSGLFALSGVLAALHVREQHPEGQHVQIAMLDAALNMMSNYIPSVTTLGYQVPRLGRGHAQIVPYQAFPCSDGQYVMVGAFTRGFWQNLARALGHEEWISDERFASNAGRLANRGLLCGMLEDIFKAKPCSHWLGVLEAADVPCSPVLELHDAVKSEQVLHNQSLMNIGEAGKQYAVVRSPIRVDAWESAPPTPAPTLGENTASVLANVLKLSPEDIEDLAARDIVRLPR